MKKTTWKSVLLYIVRILELVLTGAAGGALGADRYCFKKSTLVIRVIRGNL